MEELKKKVEASTVLVEQSQQKFEEKEVGLLTSIKMREDQLKISEEGRLRAVGKSKKVGQYSSQLESEDTRHQGEPRKARAQWDSFRVEKETEAPEEPRP